MCAMSFTMDHGSDGYTAAEQHNNYMSKKCVGTTQKLCVKKKHRLPISRFLVSINFE